MFSNPKSFDHFFQIQSRSVSFAKSEIVRLTFSNPILEVEFYMSESIDYVIL